MLQEYAISDIFPALPTPALYHICSFEKADRSLLIWPHKRNFYSIVWFIEGNGFYVIDFIEYVISPGRLFLTSPEQIHNWTYQCGGKGYMLLFNRAVAAQSGIDFLSPFVDICIEEKPLLKLVVENAINKKTDSDKEIDLLYFYSLIVDKIDRRNFKPGGRNVLFREFKKLALADDLKIQSMDQYADTLHLSLAALNDICRNCAGSSAKQFLLRLKIAEAKHLLIYSCLSVSDIAYRLGFEDASYFARIFKKKTSLSPSVFIEKYRK